MEVRELTKSALTLPWAISMFGLQQVANLVAPPSSKGITGAAAAFDAVSDATEHQLDGWFKQTYDVGNGVQHTLVDLMMLRAPELDSSALMRMAAEMQSGPVFQAVMKYGLPPVAWLDSFLVPRRDAAAVQQEFANKLEIIQLVTQVHRKLGLDESESEPLPALVARTADMETFPRLWAVEGLGNYYADRAWTQGGGLDPTALLVDAGTATLPPWSLTMLHAGIGMSFAKKVLAGLAPASPPDAVQGAVARFVALCRHSSREGYAGAALESLGLAARTLYPNLVPLLDREIPTVHPELHGYFWHGAGRAMYFDPMNMLPSMNAPWRAIRRLETEAPHDLAYRNALSGLAWALTVVNMRHPAVMEAFLRHHADLAAANDAFTNGVTSSLMMRYDTTRDDGRIASFIHHAPRGDEAAVPAWRALITAPCEQALRVTYGDLVHGRALEELFHYRPQAG
jgi:hypothetical protein